MSHEPLVFIAGAMLSPLPFAMLIHLLLGFPTGRVEDRAPHALMITACVDVGLILPPAFLFTQPSDQGCEECPENPLMVSYQPGLADVIFALYGVVAIAGRRLLRRRRSRC